MHEKENGLSNESRMGGGFLDTELGIVPDSVNQWNSLQLALMEHGGSGVSDEEILRSVLGYERLTYDEYIKKTFASSGEAEEFIQKTDPEKKRVHDELVAEFNSEREAILKNKDYERLQELLRRAKEIYPFIKI